MYDKFTKEEALRLYILRKNTNHTNFEELEHRLCYHYQSTDGSYNLPETLEGSLLKFVIAEIEGRKEERCAQLRERASQPVTIPTYAMEELERRRL